MHLVDQLWIGHSQKSHWLNLCRPYYLFSLKYRGGKNKSEDSKVQNQQAKGSPGIDCRAGLLTLDMILECGELSAGPPDGQSRCIPCSFMVVAVVIIPCWVSSRGGRRKVCVLSCKFDRAPWWFGNLIWLIPPNYKCGLTESKICNFHLTLFWIWPFGQCVMYGGWAFGRLVCSRKIG